MSIFDEAARKGKQDKILEEQASKKAYSDQSNKADKEKQEKEQKLSIKLQEARGLLMQVGASNLLASIRREAWGCGEVVVEEGSFRVTTSGLWKEVKVEEFKWPKTSLIFEKTNLRYAKINPPKLIIGFGMTGGEREKKKDGFCKSSLIITTEEQQGQLGLLIERENITNMGLGGGIYQPKYAEVLKGLGGVIIVGPQNRFDKERVFVSGLSSNSRGLTTEILQRIVYEDARQNQLPNDFLARHNIG